MFLRKWSNTDVNRHSGNLTDVHSLRVIQNMKQAIQWFAISDQAAWAKQCWLTKLPNLY
jgi:hypothetical protein